MHYIIQIFELIRDTYVPYCHQTRQNTAIFKRIVCQVFANVNGGESYAIA